MKLTKNDSIRISIELWTWLAETGAESKRDWDGWFRNGGSYEDMNSDCPFCEFARQCWRLLPMEEHREREECNLCPYFQRFVSCGLDTPYTHWETARMKKTRKKWATLFLEQLKQL